MRHFVTLLCAANLALLGCKKSEEPDEATYFIEPPSYGNNTSEPTGPTCGATELCARSIDECEVNLTQGDCEAWYADTSQCLDMAGYESCNCLLYTSPSPRDGLLSRMPSSA